MSENIPRLPERPNLDQLRKQAKELQTGEKLTSLSAAQHTLARRYGFSSWPKLKLALESQTLRRLIEARDVKGVQQIPGIRCPLHRISRRAPGSCPLAARSRSRSELAWLS